MTFSEWGRTSPRDAAHEIHRRIQTRLSPAQQRAAIAEVSSEEELEESFARVDPKAPLAGVPYFLKDLYPVAGRSMRAGSTFLPEVRPPASSDSTLVRRLRDAGAVLAGRSHLHEFAYGITGENPHYGDCEHPRFPGRLTGGSSSGSAALVAAGIVPFAIGSDTGGSIRLPAAFCGLFGFRLSPRDATIADALPLAPSYDTAGWFTATGADMLAALRALVDPTAAGREPRGIYLELPGLDAEVAVACRAAAARLATVRDPDAEAALLGAFASSTATYNTVVADEAWRVHAPWAEKFKERYDPGVWQRLTRAHALTAADRAAAAQSAHAIAEAWRNYFRSHDFLVLPASPFPALTKAGCTLENRNRILRLTTPASIGGQPVLTLPVALPSGLSTGLQIVLPEAGSFVAPWALKHFTGR
ncbi:MAG: Amidase [Verrucomicrobia bacterium]|nr:Amidase [Verrucomicrobiota bacterium]